MTSKPALRSKSKDLQNFQTSNICCTDDDVELFSGSHGDLDEIRSIFQNIHRFVGVQLVQSSLKFGDKT
jgi:hypothetical protein